MTMNERPTATRGRRSQAGFALILAILALMLLTFLGLTLALSTSTELQIATNYRWSQQAWYNAEAGLEYAKESLTTADWRIVLPPARTDITQKPTPWLQRPGPWGEPNRDFEMADCDLAADAQTAGKGSQGYGVVLDLAGDPAPLQNTSDVFPGFTLNGTFTIWVRRPMMWDPATNQFVDNPANNLAIVTVEGTAPYVGQASIGGLGRFNRAVRYLEATLNLFDPSGCENLTGQEGGGPGGMGFDQCSPIGPGGVPGPGGGAAVGEQAGVQ
jgi:hypothetical protein